MKAPHVFLSYASEDREDVRRLALDLRRAGINVWLDEWEIKVGESISRKIEDGIARCDYLAIWLTERSVNSGWVDREWRAMFVNEIRGDASILPLLAEDCRLPVLLRDVKYADFRKGYDQALQDLMRSIFHDPSSSNLPRPDVLLRAAAYLLGWYIMAALLPAADKEAMETNIARLLQVFPH